MKRSALYNIYPSLYNGIDDIAQDIPRIKDLGFEGVWINPLFETSSVPSPQTQKSGSPYGPQSFRLDSTHTQGEQYSDAESSAAVRELTDLIRAEGMRVLADVVFLHVAHSHPLITNDRDQFLSCSVLSKIPDDIDTSRWFSSHTQNMGGDLWDDVIPFNFDDPEIKQQILEYYLKPYASKIVKEWGFDGLRIDSAGLLPQEIYEEIVYHAENICKQEHGHDLSVLCETVGLAPNEYEHLNGVCDSCYSSSYWMLLGDLCEWQIEGQDHTLIIKNWHMGMDKTFPENQRLSALYSHFSAVLNDDEGTLQHLNGFMKNYVAPTLGFIDNHDTASSADIFRKMGFGDHAIRQLNRLAMAKMAFAHDGWFLTSGSEFLRDSSSVFTASPDDIHRDCVDNQDFVKQINETLASMPDVRQEWKQLVFDPLNPDIFAVIIHPEEGFKQKPDLIIVNTSDSPRIIDMEFARQILNDGLDRSACTSHKETTLSSVHLCGNVISAGDFGHVACFVNGDINSVPEPKADSKAHKPSVN